VNKKNIREVILPKGIRMGREPKKNRKAQVASVLASSKPGGSLNGKRKATVYHETRPPPE